MRTRKNNYLLISASIIFLALIFSASKLFYEKRSYRRSGRSGQGKEEVLAKEREGWINYAVSKRDLDGDGGDEIIRLFKSTEPAGAFPDGKPAYALDLTVTDGRKTVYSLADDLKKAPVGESAGKYFFGETLDFFDATGDDVPDVGFKSASSSGGALNHFLYFDGRAKNFVRLAPAEFVPTAERVFSWIKKGNNGFPLVAEKADNAGEAPPFKFVFKKYSWDSDKNVFEPAGEIVSVGSYEAASQALYNEGNSLPFNDQ